jgi:hypothetical protein
LVEIAQARDEIFYASRIDPEHPWVQWTVSSMTTTYRTGVTTAATDTVDGVLDDDHIEQASRPR